MCLHTEECGTNEDFERDQRRHRETWQPEDELFAYRGERERFPGLNETRPNWIVPSSSRIGLISPACPWTRRPR